MPSRRQAIRCGHRHFTAHVDSVLAGPGANDNGSGLRAAINLDMVGVGDFWRFGSSEDLIHLALGAATLLYQVGR
jgi:Zn-dependent M28 family amino/carboxypeptidase